MNGSFGGIFKIMKRSVLYFSAISLLACAEVAFSQVPNERTPHVSPEYQPPVADILSDTQGVDFGPYMRQALQLMGRLWLSSASIKVASADNAQTGTIIRFTISPEGKISAMQLVESAHEIEIDRAAWGAITGVGELPPLPREFNGPNLVLRVGFGVNPARP
jgi:TonB family protein